MQQHPEGDSRERELVRSWLWKMRGRLTEGGRQPQGLLDPRSSRTFLRLAASDPDEVRTLLRLPHGVSLLPQDRPRESTLPLQLSALVAPHSQADLQEILQHLAWVTTNLWEERGVLTLFLVYGLLEWKGRTEPVLGRRRLAPLWLHPVSLRCEGGNGQWRLEGLGRVVLNPSVEEILRERDGIDLSSWSATMPLRTSIEWIQGRLGAGSGEGQWQVTSEWILTNLSPHGYQMSADLDPRVWPEDRLLCHPLIRQFALGQPLAPPELGGEQRRQGEIVDALESDGQMPRLIEIADSTQHLALREVLRGRSLVIEAPPGTGKSRTIVNLIAAAMGAGKTILVVASKVNGLVRLRSRLARAGLGDFCLHLGDGRGQGLLGEGIVSTAADLALRLRQRLPRRGSWQMPAELPHLRVERGRLLQQRIAYRETMAQPCGASGLTLAQVIGERERLSQELSFPLAVVEAIQLPNVEQLHSEAIAERERAAQLYAQSLASLCERHQLGGHPWRGVCIETLSLEEERELRELLQTVATVALRIETEIDLFRLAHRVVFEANQEQLQQLLELEAQLPTVTPMVDRSLLPRLVDRQGRGILLRLLTHCREVEEREAWLASFLEDLPRLELTSVEQGIEACRRAKRIDLDRRPIEELRSYTAWAHRLADDLTRTGRLFEECAHHFEIPFAFDLATARVVARAVAVCAEAPLGVIHLRHPLLEEAKVGPILAQAHQEAVEIEALGRELNQRLDLTLAPSLDQVRRHVRTCGEVDLFRLTTARYRQARHDWRVMSRQSLRPTRQRLARDYRQLLHYQQRSLHFRENPLYRRELGQLFRGIETPFQDLQSLIDWSERVWAALGMEGEVAAQMATAILRLPVAHLRALHRRGIGEDGVGNQLRQLLDKVAAALPSLPPSLQQETTSDLNYLTQQVRELAEEAQGIIDDLDEAGLLEVEGSIASLHGQLLSVRELREGEEMIEEDRVALGLLGERGLPTRAERQRWEATADFVREVCEEGGLPSPLWGWLLTPAIDERIVALRGLISALRLDLPVLQEATRRWGHLVQLHEEQWVGFREAAGRRQSLRQIRKRAEQGLAAWEQLPLWLGMRRARQELLGLGLAPLVAMVERGDLPSSQMVKAIHAIYYGSLLREAYRRHPLLERFQGVEQEEGRRQYVELDARVEQLTREEIAWQVDRRPVPPGFRQGPIEERTELGFLEALAKLDAPPFPIRHAWERAGAALNALLPCLLISPAHIAAYLPTDLDPYDLVILDDASRLRTEEVLGAVARAKQVVVVGDPLQLPPPEDGREQRDGEPETSLLDLPAIQASLPHRLRWHSQSQHESLIAFSNRQWYGDRLVVLPSARREGSADGVAYRLVREGRYEAGVNPREAAALVEAVLHHLLTAPEESLGLVALSERQRDWIETRLTARLAESPTAAARVKEWHDRGLPVFIKTVETMHGEVRDAVLVSLTAGRDSLGRISPGSFGCLNHPRYGHRSLNVLVTRARRRLLLFGSVLPEEVPVEHSATPGLEALRDYLQSIGSTDWAALGVTWVGGPSLVHSLARLLQAHGYQVEPFPDGGRGLLDLAICTREQTPTGSLAPSLHGPRELLGVRLEGIGAALEPEAFSTRDRERVAPELLARLGWPPLHRLWPLDWFRQRSIELRRLQRLLDGTR